MEGSFCLSESEEFLSMLDASTNTSVRAYLGASEKRASSVAAGVEEVALKRRPLSPICPYTSLADVPHTLAWWNRSPAKQIIPLGMSIAFHASLLIAGIVTISPFSHRSRLDRVIEGAPDTSSPQAVTIVADANPLPTMNDLFQPSRAGETDVEVQSDIAPREPSVATASQLDTPANVVAGSELNPPSNDEPIMLGMSAASAIDQPKPVHRSQNSGAVIASARPPETATFFGVGGNARTVVYLCDASGSMLGNDEAIATQLQHAVLALQPSQQFNVVFFGGNAPRMLNASQLVTADPPSKLAACSLARQYACHGKTNALPAIREALKFRPDVLYFVTDGALENADEQEVLKSIRQANSDGNTQINVILISGAPQTDATGVPFFKTLAEETGGSCRIVNPESM